MDPMLLNALAPVAAMVSLGATVVGFFWVGKHYKLREKELELEAQLHAKAIEAQVRAMEVRLAALETSVIGRGLPATERAALMEPPPLPLKER